MLDLCIAVEAQEDETIRQCTRFRRLRPRCGLSDCGLVRIERERCASDSYTSARVWRGRILRQVLRSIFFDDLARPRIADIELQLRKRVVFRRVVAVCLPEARPIVTSEAFFLWRERELWNDDEDKIFGLGLRGLRIQGRVLTDDP